MTKNTPERQSEERYLIHNEAMLSGRDIADNNRLREGFATCIREKVEPLEEQLDQKNAENVRLRALGAELANSINILIGVRRDVESLLTLNEKTALAAVAAWTAKELGFVPANTDKE